MAFEKPITIRSAVERVQRAEYVLPAIQREFIWKPEQITSLFDSLMRGYPIGSFLFWNVKQDKCQDYKFYRLLSEYHERDQRHNPLFDPVGDAGVTVILDGQQRLTSLHIGLTGSYTDKIKHKRRDNPDAYPCKHLYLDILQPASGEDIGLSYNFRFLTSTEAKKQNGAHWFRVNNILKFEVFRDINKYLRKHDLLELEYPETCLYKLFEVVCKDSLINYYQEEDQDLDKVLNIFIRINSGGTQLSHSDLLLSIATAQWDEYDARQEIHKIVDDINRTGQGFNLSKDFVLKSCLVLADISDIGFKVKNFTRENTTKIEHTWSNISRALRDAVTLASRFGYNGNTLSANNVLIPIAYYLLTRQKDDGYLERSEFSDDRDAVRKWITRALLKTGTFGSGLDTTLRVARSTIKAHPATFPVQQMDTEFAKIGKALRFEEEELDALLDHTCGTNTAFSVLALLYPNINFAANRFHEDHIFPKANFTRTRLLDAGIPEHSIDLFQDFRDRIANLQLLEGIPNQEKSIKMPAEWLQDYCSDNDALQKWKHENFINDIPSSMKSFLDFYSARRKKMKVRLARILDVKIAD